jgi:RNA polymerase sigma-54 factor
MRQSLQLRLGTSLALTPQLQQSIKLLQLSTLELASEIETFLADNPLLEREETYTPPAVGLNATLNGPLGASTGAEAANAPANDPASPSTDDGHWADRADSASERWDGETLASDTGDGANWESAYIRGPGDPYRDPTDDDGRDGDRYGSDNQGALRDHLVAQLASLNLSGRDRGLVEFLIEALDDDGFLADPLHELLDLLPRELEIDPDEIMVALKHVQQLEPAGVGARSLGECVCLQLRALPAASCPKDARTLAERIALEDLAALGNREFGALRRKFGTTDDALRAAHALIKRCNPRPAAQFSQAAIRYVSADVIVRKVRGQWQARLNGDAVPRLRINRAYADALKRARRATENNVTPLLGQLQEARWLLKNIQQRFETIERVAQAIVERQRHFFDHGEVAMRPLVLREIADTLGLHESTISRVTTAKYMLTPRGIFELKYFFGSHVATDSGGAASSTAIRALIKQLIAAEPGNAPLSDSTIAEMLGKQGIVVARRTVAKYRESLGIPQVNQRKAG